MFLTTNISNTKILIKEPLRQQLSVFNTDDGRVGLVIICLIIIAIIFFTILHCINKYRTNRSKTNLLTVSSLIITSPSGVPSHVRPATCAPHKVPARPNLSSLINPRHLVVNRYSQSLVQTANSNRSIKIQKGDLTTESVDVIVVCSSSQCLRENIFKVGGDVIKTSYERKSKQKPSTITAVSTGGTLPSKKIYFLPWQPNSDDDTLCKSLKKFVSDAINKAASENYNSIAFPAIGCGQFSCTINLVAKSMVEEAYRLQETHAISVSFIIEPNRTDIYDEFQKQVDSLKQPSTISDVSVSIGNGKIVVEKGDITLQNVDAIIGNSSSQILQQAIINAAGNEVKTAYEKEDGHNPNSILISTSSGQLPCKRIFFLKWNPNQNDSILRQSIVDLIINVIHHVIAYDYTSIAFPAIGCGKHGCSIDIVVKTMVKEIKKQLTERKLSLLVKFVIEPDQQNIYDEFCKQVLASDEEISGEIIEHHLPRTWEKSTDNRLRFVVLSNTNEYKFVSMNFDQTMKGIYTQIIQIERIQNRRWLIQYLAHSRDFKNRLKTDTEKCLYHGCDEQAANSIIEDCFNRSFAGKNGIVYGVGVYFSSNAAYSHGYTRPNTNGERCMFVARVLIGKTTIGNSSMKVRPLGFDSTTDGNHIFVIYHDAQAIAEYLITYK